MDRPGKSPPPLELVCQKAIALPCTPILLPRLQKVLHDPHSSGDDIVAVIKMDTGLAASTLKLANSAIFAYAQVGSLDEAVFRLGLREIYKLAVSSLALRWLNFPVLGYGWELGDFARFSVSLAVSAECLAQRRGGVEPSVAYTAGLLQDFGKLAIAYTCHEFFPAIRQHQEAHGCPWWEAEKAVLGYDYMEAGGRLARTWKFPHSLASAMQYSLHPRDASLSDQPLLLILMAARLLVGHLGAGMGEDGYLYHAEGAWLQDQGYTDVLLNECAAEILPRLQQLLGESFHHGAVQFAGQQ